jgi:hypothetical protein
MSYFRCRSCNAVYEDHYPPDDTCLKCKTGTIRIIEETIHQPDHQESGFSNSKEKA